VANAAQQLFDGGGNAGQAGGIESTDSSEDVADSPRKGLERARHVEGENRRGEEARLFGCGGKSEWRHWEFEPELGRVAHGIPHRVDRLKGLGNAIVPQIAEMIGRWIQFREEITR
jgi:DNA (cytosine-5)-methyltransferase 1